MNAITSGARGVHHVNYLVEDIPAAVDRWVEVFGAGPFFWLGERIEFDECNFRGESCVLDHGAVIGRWGNIFVEFSHVYDISPSPFEQLFLGGRGNDDRIGHTSYVAVDGSAERARLDALGMPFFFYARQGPVAIRFHDAYATLGHPIEIHQESEALAGGFGVIAAAAEGWDGSDPLRHLPPPPAAA
jgi:hypothetical protein